MPEVKINDYQPSTLAVSELELHLIKEHREGRLMYLSDAEKEMVTAFRQEKEIINNEQNEQSPNMKSVKEIFRLAEYIAPHSGFFGVNPNAVDVVNLAIEIANKNEERLNLITSWHHKYLNTYQDEAAETAIYPGKGTPLGLIYCALKLSGEAGEVAENVGKALRDDELFHLDKESEVIVLDEVKEDRRNKIKLELGDVLWYISQAAKELGYSLEEIAQANLEKLGNRAKNGTLKGSGDDR